MDVPVITRPTDNRVGNAKIVSASRERGKGERGFAVRCRAQDPDLESIDPNIIRGHREGKRIRGHEPVFGVVPLSRVTITFGGVGPDLNVACGVGPPPGKVYGRRIRRPSGAPTLGGGDLVSRWQIKILGFPVEEGIVVGPCAQIRVNDTDDLSCHYATTILSIRADCICDGVRVMMPPTAMIASTLADATAHRCRW